MADCYYHGQSGSGPCPDCEYADKHGKQPEEVSSTQETLPMDKKMEVEDAMMQKIGQEIRRKMR